MSIAFKPTDHCRTSNLCGLTGYCSSPRHCDAVQRVENQDEIMRLLEVDPSTPPGEAVLTNCKDPKKCAVIGCVNIMNCRQFRDQSNRERAGLPTTKDPDLLDHISAVGEILNKINDDEVELKRLAAEDARIDDLILRLENAPPTSSLSAYAAATIKAQREEIKRLKSKGNSNG